MMLDKLRKKRVIDVEAEEVTEEPAIKGDALDEAMTTDIQLPQIPADINPFSDTSEDMSAVHAALATIDPNPEKIALIGNSSNPRANAIGDTVTNYIATIAGNKQAGIKELADFGKSIINNCIKHQIGQAGKDNRAIRVLDMLKAERQMEHEQELSMGDKAFGKR